MKRYLISLLLLSATALHAAIDSTDIIVVDKVAVQRCTLGGPTSRMIAVGHPGGSNFAFDAVNCRPVYAWHGGFLDYRGETQARGGRGGKVLGVKRPLGTHATPFRTGNPGQMPQSVEFHGYRRDARTGDPTFQFEVDGMAVEQRLAFPAPETVRIEFRFPEGAAPTRFYHLNPGIHNRVELSKGLRWFSAGVIAIPANVRDATITVALKPTDKVFTRKLPNLSGAEAFRLYCAPCHSSDGSKLAGPSFKGLWGRTQNITRNGRTETITVNADYLLESIMTPQAAIVKGYEQVPMANFSGMLTKEQIARLVDHLKTFK